MAERRTAQQQLKDRHYDDDEINIEDAIEEFLGSKLTIAGLTIANQEQHSQSSNNNTVAETSPLLFKDELHHVASTRQYKLLRDYLQSQRIKRTDETHSSSSPPPPPPSSNDGDEVMMNSSAQTNDGTAMMMTSTAAASTKSFSLFDLNMLPSINHNCITIHDILQQKSPSQKEEEEETKTLLEKCQKVNDVVQDLLADFDTTDEDVLQLSILLQSALSSSTKQNVITKFTTEQRGWLEIHEEWFQQSLAEYRSFAILLLRNVLLYQCQILNESSSSFRRRDGNRKNEKNSKANIQSDCPMMMMLLAHVIQVVYRMLSMLSTSTNSTSQQGSKDEFCNMFLLHLQSSFNPNYDDSDIELNLTQHLHFACLDPNATVFNQLVSSCVESPMELRTLVEQSGLLNYLLKTLNRLFNPRTSNVNNDKDEDLCLYVSHNTDDNDDDNDNETVISISYKDANHAIMVHSLCMLRKIITDLFTIQSFPFPFPSQSRCQSGNNNRHVGISTLLLPNTLDDLDKFFLKIQQINESRNRVVVATPNSSDIWMILRPFYFILEVSIGNKIHDSKLLSICEEAIQYILIGCIFEKKLWEEIMMQFIGNISSRIVAQNKSPSSNPLSECSDDDCYDSLLLSICSFYRICREVLTHVSWGEFTEHGKKENEPKVYDDSDSSSTTETSSWESLLNSLKFILSTAHDSTDIDLTSRLIEAMNVLQPILQSSIAISIFGRKQILGVLEKFTKIIDDKEEGMAIYLPMACTPEGLYFLDNIGIVGSMVEWIDNAIWKGEFSYNVGQWAIDYCDLLAQLCCVRDGYNALLCNYKEYDRILGCNMGTRSSISPTYLSLAWRISSILASGPKFASKHQCQSLTLSNALIINQQYDQHSLEWSIHLLEEVFYNQDLVIATSNYHSKFHTTIKENMDNHHILDSIDGSLGSPSTFQQRTVLHTSQHPIATASSKDSFWMACDELSQGNYTALDVVETMGFLVKDTKLKEIHIHHDGNDEDRSSLFCQKSESYVQKCFERNSLPALKVSNLRLHNIIISECGDNGQYRSLDCFNVCLLALCKSDVNVTYSFLKEKTNGIKIGNDFSSLYPIIKEIQTILEIDCPEILTALEMCGSNLAPILTLWLRQCYLGILSFGDAILFSTIIMEKGMEYAVYLTVAAFHYLQEDIITFATSRSSKSEKQCLLPSLSKKLQSFRVVDSIDFANNQRRRHPIDLPFHIK